MSTLRDKTISGIFWSFLEKVGAKGINFVVIIILARLLMPSDFGLIAMLTIFIDLSLTLVNAGFGQALIQKEDTGDEDYSVVFYINLVVCLVLYGILYLTAPLIAEFYNQPLLVKLTRVFSLLFVINAFSNVQSSRLNKEMAFKALAYIHIPAVLIGGIVSIVMAYQDFGVWSLVAFQLVYRLVYAVEIWFYAKWKPLPFFSFQKAEKLFSFGSKLLIGSVLNVLFRNAYLVVVGKFFPVATLGYYENAQKLERIPSVTLSRALSSVTFSAFSSIQRDNKRLKNAYKRVMQQQIFLTAPLFIFAGILATPLFRLVLTEKWLPAVPFFQMLCIVAIVRPLCSYNLQMLNVKGRSDLFLKLNIITKIITAIGIAFSVSFGIWYLVGFQVVNIFITYGVNSFYSGKLMQYPVKEQLKDLMPILLLGILAGVLVWILDNILSGLSDIFRLLMSFGIGIGAYWLISKKLRFESYTVVKEIFQDKMFKTGKK